MAEDRNTLKGELKRLRRVADQSCTAHSVLKQRYERIAFIVNAAILLLSAFLVALGLADDEYLEMLSLQLVDPKFGMGVLAIFTFCLSLIELKSDWKSRAEAHSRSFTMYSEVKREASYLLASSDEIPLRDFQRLAARYDMASDIGVTIPDSKFLQLKQKHKMKVSISKMLDDRSFAPIFCLKLGLIYRDVFSRKK